MHKTSAFKQRGTDGMVMEEKIRRETAGGKGGAEERVISEGEGEGGGGGRAGEING